MVSVVVLAIVGLGFTGLLEVFQSAPRTTHQSDPSSRAPAGGGIKDVDKIAFVAVWTDGNGEFIYSVNPDGSNLVLVTGPLSTAWTSWKPDRTKLALNQRLSDGSDELDVMNSDGSGMTTIATIAANHLDWSPDGTRIAFVSTDGHVKLVNADGTGVVEQLVAPGLNCIIVRVAWSPDSSKVAFAKECTSGGGTGVYTSTLSGTIVQLTSGVDSGEGSTVPTNVTSYAGLSWSPDGTQIVFAAFTPDTSATVYVMNADGSGVHSIAQGNEPAWSNSGTTIAFIANDTIQLVSPGGGPITSLNLSTTVVPLSLAW